MYCVNIQPFSIERKLFRATGEVKPKPADYGIGSLTLDPVTSQRQIGTDNYLCGRHLAISDCIVDRFCEVINCVTSDETFAINTLDDECRFAKNAWSNNRVRKWKIGTTQTLREIIYFVALNCRVLLTAWFYEIVLLHNNKHQEVWACIEYKMIANRNIDF